MTQRFSYRGTFAVLALGVATFALLQSMVIPALTTLQHQFHTSQTAATWVLTAYLLSAAIMTQVLGRIGDIAGKERVFLATLVALAAGSLMAAVAPSIGVMLVARIVQGAGGGMVPVAFGIVRDEFPPEKMTGAVGVLASLIAVGAGLGIVLAGPIVEVLDYRWLFWLPMILTLIAAGAATLFIPKSPMRSPGRVNWASVALLSCFLVPLLVALSEAPTWGWSSTRVVALLIASTLLAILWVRSELRAGAPLIDMRMMRIPALWTCNLVTVLMGMGMYASGAFLPDFVQSPPSGGYGFGVSVTMSGLMLLPSSLAMFVAGLLAGRLARRAGTKAVVVIGCATASAGLNALVILHSSPWQIYLSNSLTGLGFGFAISGISALIVVGVPVTQTAVASGVNTNIRTIGGCLGTTVMTTILASHHHGSGSPTKNAYLLGFGVLGVALLMAAFAARLVPGEAPNTPRVVEAST